MKREYLNPKGAWDTAGRSYSHVVKISAPESLIFVAGQAPVGENFEILGDDIVTQTRATFDNIGRALAAAGATLADIVDMTVYLDHLDEDKWAVRQVREELYPDGGFPVSTMIGVTGFAVAGMRIEIDVIAAI
jgi:enamine deaminase RidA (YjgF/YER057c/UK114 family)